MTPLVSGLHHHLTRVSTPSFRRSPLPVFDYDVFILRLANLLLSLTSTIPHSQDSTGALHLRLCQCVQNWTEKVPWEPAEEQAPRGRGASPGVGRLSLRSCPNTSPVTGTAASASPALLRHCQSSLKVGEKSLCLLQNLRKRTWAAEGISLHFLTHRIPWMSSRGQNLSKCIIPTIPGCVCVNIYICISQIYSIKSSKWATFYRK